MNTRRLWERRQDTEPDSDAPPAGSGWTGTGRPLETGTGLLHREYCDGMGLRSPGRWRPSSRRFPSTAHWLRIAQLFYDFQDEVQPAKLLAELACGAVRPGRASRSPVFLCASSG